VQLSTRINMKNFLYFATTVLILGRKEACHKSAFELHATRHLRALDCEVDELRELGETKNYF
jgi:hypothetical protein